jgi:hypothetical protein
MLIALFFWKHCNGCVCEGTNPSVSQLLQEIREESTIWCSVGTSELESLWVLIFVRSGGRLFGLSWCACNISGVFLV